MTAVIMIINFQFIKKDFPGAERGQSIYFRFKDNVKLIELKFDAPQEEPFTGWNVKPHIKPCRVSITNNVYFAWTINNLIVASL